MTLLVALGLVVLLGAASVAIAFVKRRRRREEPQGRPIETVVADLRRLGSRYHQLHRGASYAKVEAVRGAYDRSLAECCAALGIVHLLSVLPSGPELDAERARVEWLLDNHGVDLPFAA